MKAKDESEKIQKPDFRRRLLKIKPEEPELVDDKPVPFESFDANSQNDLRDLTKLRHLVDQ